VSLPRPAAITHRPQHAGNGTATEWNLNIIVTHTHNAQPNTRANTPNTPQRPSGPWSRHEHRFTWTDLDLETRKEIEAGPGPQLEPSI